MITSYAISGLRLDGLATADKDADAGAGKLVEEFLIGGDRVIPDPTPSIRSISTVSQLVDGLAATYAKSVTQIYDGFCFDEGVPFGLMLAVMCGGFNSAIGTTSAYSEVADPEHYGVVAAGTHLDGVFAVLVLSRIVQFALLLLVQEILHRHDREPKDRDQLQSKLARS